MEICNTLELEKSFDIKFYYCGSINLCKFLYSKKIVPVSSFVSKKTGKMVWKFVKCDDLDCALNEWQSNKGGKRNDG